MGRVRFAEKNILFGYVGQAATMLMSFVLRTIFIQNLSEQLLGINSTYSNVLSILSMAELGIGTALNFALYKPVAENDREKIKSYMQMYRKAYTVIAFVVACIGLVLVPFLPRLVKNSATRSRRTISRRTSTRSQSLSRQGFRSRSSSLPGTSSSTC